MERHNDKYVNICSFDRLPAVYMYLDNMNDTEYNQTYMRNKKNCRNEISQTLFIHKDVIVIALCKIIEIL